MSQLDIYLSPQSRPAQYTSFSCFSFPAIVSAAARVSSRSEPQRFPRREIYVNLSVESLGSVGPVRMWVPV
eukprot:1337002-Amorphochlora_amoeboformis.AAC.2